MTTAPSLSQRAMLVDLTIKKLTVSKHDRQVSREVAQNHGSDVTMGRFQKSLLAKEAMEQINGVASAAYTDHRKRTLPWADSGARALSSAGYLDYTAKMREYSDLWDEAVAVFKRNYPDYVLDAQYRLNGLFNASEYPPVSQIGDKFAFGYNVFPLPDASDFRVQLSVEETNAIRAQIEETSKQALQRAQQEVVERIREAVGHMADRLREYGETLNARAASNETGKAGAPRLFDSLVENIRELVGLIPTLNLTNDPALDHIAQEMQNALCYYSVDALRISQEKRELTIEAADAILESVAAFAA